jgi:acetolactate synthase-1/2/3 large subunit
LISQGVDTVFGYPGGAVLNIYNALYDNRERVRHILTSHEQGAAHAADGFARTTGRTGVVIATSGPGATNLVTGIATSLPRLGPDGRDHRERAARPHGRDSFQEVYDHTHHDACHQAQLHRQAGRGHGGDRAGGVYHRQFRRPGPS